MNDISEKDCDFGARLKELMERAGISGYRLARASWVTHSFIYRILREKGICPRWNVVCQLADALGVDVSEFRRRAA